MLVRERAHLPGGIARMLAITSSLGSTLTGFSGTFRGALVETSGRMIV
jgi:hypothetical protein